MGLINLTDDSEQPREPLLPNMLYRFRKSGRFDRNEVTGFHGVFASAGLNHFMIYKNVLRENSFVNFSFSGRNIGIKGNKIYYPGRGTTGDGITGMDTLINVDFLSNDIIGGSCYGISLLVNFSRSVRISDNNIIGGITSAVIVAHEPGSAMNDVKGIDIVSNVMFGNVGFAVAVETGDDIRIEKNQMANNATGFGEQIYLRSSSKNVIITGNTKFIPLTPAWEEGLGHSHVSPGDKAIVVPLQ